jgi:hypothetical protein
MHVTHILDCRRKKKARYIFLHRNLDSRSNSSGSGVMARNRSARHAGMLAKAANVCLKEAMTRMDGRYVSHVTGSE